MNKPLLVPLISGISVFLGALLANVVSPYLNNRIKNKMLSREVDSRIYYEIVTLLDILVKKYKSGTCLHSGRDDILIREILSHTGTSQFTRRKARKLWRNLSIYILKIKDCKIQERIGRKTIDDIISCYDLFCIYMNKIALAREKPKIGEDIKNAAKKLKEDQALTATGNRP